MHTKVIEKALESHCEELARILGEVGGVFQSGAHAQRGAAHIESAVHREQPHSGETTQVRRTHRARHTGFAARCTTIKAQKSAKLATNHFETLQIDR